MLRRGQPSLHTGGFMGGKTVSRLKKESFIVTKTTCVSDWNRLLCKYRSHVPPGPCPSRFPSSLGVDTPRMCSEALTRYLDAKGINEYLVSSQFLGHSP